MDLAEKLGVDRLGQKRYLPSAQHLITGSSRHDLYVPWKMEFAAYRCLA
jgi:hypothetical protein